MDSSRALDERVCESSITFGSRVRHVHTIRAALSKLAFGASRKSTAARGSVPGARGLPAGVAIAGATRVNSGRRLAPRSLALVLAVALVAAFLWSLRIGSTDASSDFSSACRGAAAALGICDPLPDSAQQWIVSLRLWRTLTAAGVGAALGLSGAFVQGLFRNGLASPGVLGISGGASLGAFAAVLVVGGYGPNLVLGRDAVVSGLVLIPIASFAAALIVGYVVYRLASTGGRVSVPALLLTGIAMNTFVGGLLQLIQLWVIGDWEVSKSILSWTFGTLTDRSGWHAATVWIAVAIALVAVPFTAWELDLFQAGIEDAEALGVDTRRVRWLVLSAAALSAAAAVAVAGQIAFVGLVVPHLVRLTSGVSHRSLLPLSMLLGALFLLAADLGSRLFLRDLSLPPGVLMSLVGGPFFVYLLWAKRREIGVW
jgi:iron complex transport system permease protein